MQELKDRVAVVTGGGSGIGRGMAHAFADAGMRVVLADIESDAAERVRREVEERGVPCLATQTDVTRREDLVALADHVYDAFGACHLLCNNAGVATFAAMDASSADDWSWVLAVNLHGVVHGLQAFLPRMREQAGEKHVVNTASIAALGGFPGLGPYVASKHAVLGISETLRLEGRTYELSCSVLCPGNVNTGIVASARNRQPDFGGPEAQQDAEYREAIERGMDPLDVGRMVRQAVLDDDAFIFTHPESRRIVERRYQAMCEAYDKTERRGS